MIVEFLTHAPYFGVKSAHRYMARYFPGLLLQSHMDLSYIGILPKVAGYAGLGGMEKIKSNPTAGSNFTHPVKASKSKQEPLFLPLRNHMIVSIFCGEYPLEMRAGRRLKDA